MGFYRQPTTHYFTYTLGIYFRIVDVSSTFMPGLLWVCTPYTPFLHPRRCRWLLFLESRLLSQTRPPFLPVKESLRVQPSKIPRCDLK